MNRSASLRLLFFLAALTAASQTGFVSGAGRKPPLAEETQEYEEREQKFNFYLDQGLSAYINEQNYEIAIRNFEAALVLKPKDPTARKSLRLAREKAGNRPLKPLIREPAPAASVPQTQLAIEPILTPGATTDALSQSASETPAEVKSFTESISQPTLTSGTTAAAPAVPPAEKTIFTPVQATPPPSLLEYPVKEDPKRAAREKERQIKNRYREGVMAYMIEDYSKAVKAMEAILEIDPGNAKARKLLMKAYSYTK